MSTKLIQFFFELQTNVKLFHWMTTSYAKHIATDLLTEKLLGLIDKMVEVYIGKNKRPVIGKTGLKLQVGSMSDAEMFKYLNSAIDFLNTKTDLNPASDLELINIRDEIVAELQQTLYRFTLQ